MYIAINSTELPVYPITFEVTVLDLDDAETTTRTADGQLTRDRIAVKRQIDMSFNAMRWADMSATLQLMADEFFDVTYPDPYTGAQATKTFYVGNRKAAVAIVRNGEYWWTGLQFSLIER